MHVLNFSSGDVSISLLQWYYVCFQQVAIALQIWSNLAYIDLKNIMFILVFNWIYLFVLEFVIVSRCHCWGFGMYNSGYIEHDYAMVLGILGIE